MSDYVLAIDQGTTNTKALLIDAAQNVVCSFSAPVRVTYPRPGWAEASAEDLWQSVQRAALGVLAQADAARIVAIGVSNQRESVMLWDRRSGEPVGPCVIWQCRRSAERLERLRTPAVEANVQAKTGLGLDPLFPAAKIGWLLDEVPRARDLSRDGHLCAGTVDSWVVYNLTGGAVHRTEPANASRTQLFNIHTQDWDDELCALFGVDRSMLADVVDSNAEFGHTALASGLPEGIPIRAVIGDSHAALYGHGVRQPGSVKGTYGTGSSLMTLTDGVVTSTQGLSSTVAWRESGKVSYALEGNITVSGHAAAWAAQMLGLGGADELTSLASGVDDSDGVAFVPALAGLGAPHWRPDARGVFTGLSLSTTRAHLARAAIEAIAQQVTDVLEAMQADLGASFEVLLADGGASGSAFLMQIQADLSRVPVRTRTVKELSALGAAKMAGCATGFWSDDDRRSVAWAGAFAPSQSDDWRAAKRAEWARAVRASVEL